MNTPQFETWEQAMAYIADLRSDLKSAADKTHEGWKYAGEIKKKLDEARAEVERLKGIDTGDDSLCNVRRLRAELAAAREALANTLGRIRSEISGESFLEHIHISAESIISELRAALAAKEAK